MDNKFDSSENKVNFIIKGESEYENTPLSENEMTSQEPIEIEAEVIEPKDKIYNSSKENGNKSSGNGLKRAISIAVLASVLGGFSIGSGISLTNRMLSRDDISNSPVYISANADNESLVPLYYDGLNKTIVQIADEVGPSVVAITSKYNVRDYFLNTYEQKGAGSGVIFKIDGKDVFILTNNHVVDDTSELLIDFGDGKLVEADIVGKDQETDLAVIKVDKASITNIDSSKLRPVVFANSDNLKVGETAVAIGNALGNGKTVTIGVVSALNREVSSSFNTLKLIQTDAAINPGNSGGALVNSRGELIGVNTIKISDTSVEGIGYAIPVNSAKPIIEELITKGFVSRPFLGISGRDVDENISEMYELPVGVFIYEVFPNSSAAKAGLKKGDVIVSVDGQNMMTMEQLSSYIKDKKVGDVLSVNLIRDGKTKLNFTIKLRDKNDVFKQN